MPLATARGRKLISLRRCLASLPAPLLGILLALAALGLATGSAPLRATPAATARVLPPLQPWIDATPAGGTLNPPAGTYAGPVRIDRPIRIDGRGEVVIDGQGQGTVVTVRSDGVTLRRLHITGSGESHDRLDSGLLVEDGHGNTFEDNRIDDVMFGITLQRANGNRIAGNRIRSKDFDPADRGDGLRLWYSSDNRIERNEIAGIRDITVSNALRNHFTGNTVRDSRRALNLLFSHRTRIEGNLLTHNSTGITTLNSEGVVIRGNRIQHAMDASGAGVALKESASVLIHGNEIIHCAVGVMSDSPMHPVNRVVLIGNRLAHNVTGVNFYGERGGRLVLGNRFEHNLWQAVVGGDDREESHDWQGNYWDDYEGFDRDRDGTGDRPHEIWAYSDRIWMDTPMAKFFRSSPALELLDFLERLAPFASPRLIVRDHQPVAHDAARQEPRAGLPAVPEQRGAEPEAEHKTGARIDR